MKLALWLSLAGVLYAYVGYPLLIWMMARVRPQPWRIGPISPSVSVVLAVHNGAGLLEQKLNNILTLGYPSLREIIVVSDGSTDGTAEWLNGFQNPNVRKIIFDERCGKAAAINAGIACAAGEVIVFVDVRQKLAKIAISRLVSNFADPNIGCAAGELSLDREDGQPGSRAFGGLYWRYERWLRIAESKFHSPVGVSGCFYAIRRELAVPLPPGIILDDVYQPLSVLRSGYRTILDSEARVYDTWPEEVESEFHRKVRTLAGNFQLFQLAPWTLTTQNPILFQFLSHKVMRLVVPYLLAALLVTSAVLAFQSPVYLALAAVQIVAWTIAAVGLAGKVPFLHRIAVPAGALLVLNAAAVVGFYKFLIMRGPLWKIWNSHEFAPKI